MHLTTPIFYISTNKIVPFYGENCKFDYWLASLLLSIFDKIIFLQVMNFIYELCFLKFTMWTTWDLSSSAIKTKIWRRGTFEFVPVCFECDSVKWYICIFVILFYSFKRSSYSHFRAISGNWFVVSDTKRKTNDILIFLPYWHDIAW